MTAGIDEMEVAGVVVDDKAARRAPWMTFLQQWSKNPLMMSSVAPSGRQLASMMIKAIPVDARCVVELGAGTGAITRMLIGHVASSTRLLIVEMNPVLHGVLRHRFPGVQIACGDARDLDQLLAQNGAFERGQADAVISSLGLLAMPKSVQHAILAAAFAALRPGGVFVQYTYGLRAPVAVEVCEQLNLRCERLGRAWLNLPPARVFVYRRR